MQALPSVEQCRVKVFSYSGQGGNPALIVYNDEPLSVAQMADIARHSGCPEAVFLTEQTEDIISIGYFTPNGKETPLCIHGTIGAVYMLKKIIADRPTIKLCTRQQQMIISGKCENDLYQMCYQPPFQSTALPDGNEIEVARCFVGESHQSAVIATAGSPKLLIRFSDKQTLFSLVPDLVQIVEVSKVLGVNGIYAYAPSADDPSVLYARAFNPLFGIDEDIATGVAAIALVKYLYHSGQSNAKKMVVHQGDVMDAPSRIHVELIDDHQVQVKGEVVEVSF